MLQRHDRRKKESAVSHNGIAELLRQGPVNSNGKAVIRPPARISPRILVFPFLEATSHKSNTAQKCNASRHTLRVENDVVSPVGPDRMQSSQRL
jgi:hypothetical protein